MRSYGDSAGLEIRVRPRLSVIVAVCRGGEEPRVVVGRLGLMLSSLNRIAMTMAGTRSKLWSSTGTPRRTSRTLLKFGDGLASSHAASSLSRVGMTGAHDKHGTSCPRGARRCHVRQSFEPSDTEAGRGQR